MVSAEDTPPPTFRRSPCRWKHRCRRCSWQRPGRGARPVREGGIRDGLILDSRFSGRRHDGRRGGGGGLRRRTRRIGGLFLAQPLALSLFERLEEVAHDPHRCVTQRTTPPIAATSVADAVCGAHGYPNGDMAPATAAAPATTPAEVATITRRGSAILVSEATGFHR